MTFIADINAEVKDVGTPLAEAILNNHQEIIEYLKSLGAKE